MIFTLSLANKKKYEFHSKISRLDTFSGGLVARLQSRAACGVFDIISWMDTLSSGLVATLHYSLVEFVKIGRYLDWTPFAANWKVDILLEFLTLSPKND